MRGPMPQHMGTCGCSAAAEGVKHMHPHPGASLETQLPVTGGRSLTNGPKVTSAEAASGAAAAAAVASQARSTKVMGNCALTVRQAELRHTQPQTVANLTSAGAGPHLASAGARAGAGPGASGHLQTMHRIVKLPKFCRLRCGPKCGREVDRHVSLCVQWAAVVWLQHLQVHVWSVKDIVSAVAAGRAGCELAVVV